MTLTIALFYSRPGESGQCDWSSKNNTRALKPKQLNGIQPSLVSLFSPVVCQTAWCDKAFAVSFVSGIFWPVNCKLIWIDICDTHHYAFFFFFFFFFFNEKLKNISQHSLKWSLSFLLTSQDYTDPSVRPAAFPLSVLLNRVKWEKCPMFQQVWNLKMSTVYSSAVQKDRMLLWYQSQRQKCRVSAFSVAER